MLKLMYITNRTDVALLAESAGVDRIFVDLEYIGKNLRQGGMDTVQNRHTVDDIKNIREVMKKSSVLARINPIHDKTKDYGNSEEEIDAVIKAGADIVMLPYFKTAGEVTRFVDAVQKRARTLLLFETPEAVENIDEILNVPGIDEAYIGLNDLSLGYKKKFMFEPLADGTVDMIVKKFKEKNVPFGFGGLASLDGGLIPGRMVLKEHYRLGSSCVILSRSFCNTSNVVDIKDIAESFKTQVVDVRNYEELCKKQSSDLFQENKKELKQIVDKIRG